MTTSQTDSTILDAESFNACRPLLGQIAHDFNNLLTPLLAYPSLVKSHLPDGSPALDLVDAMDKASRDMIHINEQLMLLSSRGNPDKAEMTITDIIVSTLARLAAEHDVSDTIIRKNIEENLPITNVNADQLSRALEGIIKNALECMDNGLQIRISACSTTVTPDLRAQYGAPYAGEYLQVCIDDNGPGFSEEILPQAAMPFVTTKKEMRRRGSGLGLTVALVVLRDHGGFLHCANKQEGGAAVSIFLPVPVSSANVEERHTSDAEQEVAGQNGLEPRDKTRILLVDDEATILKLFHMIITSALPDCEVETAGNGKEALDLFAEKHHSVLVMDLHMPVMDGQTAFQKIIALSESRNWEPPAVIFCTGFAPPDMVSRIVSGSSRHCLLSKPVRGEILVDTIKNRIA